MSLFTVDEALCQREGFCVAECPAGIIEIRSEEAFPTPVNGAEVRCINCGHCVSVCPYSAISLARMPIAECPPVEKDLAAPSFGLGTCWAGFVMWAADCWPPLAAALGLPEGSKPVGAMMVGYPKHTFHRLPARKEATVIWKE